VFVFLLAPLKKDVSERTASPCLFAMISEVIAKVANDVIMEAQLLDDVCFLLRRPSGCIFERLERCGWTYYYSICQPGVVPRGHGPAPEFRGGRFEDEKLDVRTTLNREPRFHPGHSSVVTVKVTRTNFTI